MNGVNTKRLKMILSDILEFASGEELDDKFKRLYEDSHVAKLFAFLHQRLNHLLGFMNSRMESGRYQYHFNTDNSRELLAILGVIDKLDELKKEGVAIEFSESYRSQLESCREFLSESGGSAIPEDLKPLKLEEYDPVFVLNENSMDLINAALGSSSVNGDGFGVSEASRRDILEAFDEYDLEWHGRLPDFYKLIDRLEFGKLFVTEQHNVYAGEIHSTEVLRDDIGEVIAELETKDFLEFLCQSIHPDVRRDIDETRRLYALYNKHLRLDGYQIVETKQKAAGRPIFSYAAVNIESNLSSETVNKIDRVQIKNIVEECRRKMSNREYGDAIKDSNVLLEACIKEVYKKKTGKDMVLSKNEKKEGLNARFKELIKALDDGSDEVFQSVSKQLISIVNQLLQIRNNYGGVHDKEFELQVRHQAALVINSTITLVDYIYGFVE